MAVRKKIGNSLIFLALLLLLFTYFPIIQLYLFPHKMMTNINSGSYIQIPKIGAFAPIIENVDPFNEKEYKEALKKGVAQAKGTNFYFAHSSLPPWEMTRINTAFLRLEELKIGDEIIIKTNGHQFRYFVRENKVVWPNQVEYLTGNHGEVILQTCTPLGTAFKRLLILADPA